MLHDGATSCGCGTAKSKAVFHKSMLGAMVASIRTVSMQVGVVVCVQPVSAPAHIRRYLMQPYLGHQRCLQTWLIYTMHMQACSYHTYLTVFQVDFYLF